MNEWTWDTHITITMNYFTVFFVVSLNLCKALTTEWQACPSNTGRHFKELNWCHKSELCSIVIWSTYCLPGEVLPRSIAYRDMDYLAEPFFYFIFFFCVCVCMILPFHVWPLIFQWKKYELYLLQSETLAWLVSYWGF